MDRIAGYLSEYTDAPIVTEYIYIMIYTNGKDIIQRCIRSLLMVAKIFVIEQVSKKTKI